MSYHDALEAAAEAHFESDPEMAAAAYRYLGKLRRGEFDSWWVDLFTQHHRGEISVYDAYYFAHLHTLAMQGDLLCATIALGAAPGPDRDEAANNDALRALARLGPFRAQFRPLRGAVGNEGDGVFEWSEPLAVESALNATQPRRRAIPAG